MKFLFNNFDLLFDEAGSVDAFKKLILEMAVRGKLVPQDPNDEPASVLIEKITEERERLIKEGILKKEKPIAPIKESEVQFNIPGSWEWVRLGTIGQVVGGGTPSTTKLEYYLSNGIPWLTPADLGGYKEKYISRGKRDISELGLKSSSARLLPKGSVVFSSRAPIGYVAIAKNPLSTNQGFKSIIPYEANSNEYIYYYLKAKAQEIDSKAPSTTFREVSGKIVANILIPLPPLNEQKRIVKKIDEIYEMIPQLEEAFEMRTKYKRQLNQTSLSRLTNADSKAKFVSSMQFVTNNFDLLYDNIENVKELRQAILTLAVQGKLVPQDPNDEPASVLLEKIQKEKERLIKEGVLSKEKPLPPIKQDEVPFNLPDGWEWVVLYDVSRKIHYGYTASADIRFNDIKMLRITDIQNDTVNWNNVPGCRISELDYNRYSLQNMDILIARTGGTVGKSYLVKNLDNKAVFASYLIRIQLVENVNPDYIKRVLESPFYWKQLLQGTKGTGQPNVNATTLKKLIILIPPLNEQKRIVQKTDISMALCDDLENKILECNCVRDQLIDTVIHEAFADVS